MSEFHDVMTKWRRMCEAHRCSKCPLNYAVCCVSDPYLRTDVDIETLEELITNWEEHPEPVYPTWFEWLCSIGVWNKASDPIPANIAQKLGIKPKEE